MEQIYSWNFEIPSVARDPYPLPQIVSTDRVR
jgi:hypothetical protein